jgi:thiol-disulfide isomerase/thioredoxin
MVGIGIRYNITNDGYIRINTIINNSPAMKAHNRNILQVNDLITSIKKNNHIYISTILKSYSEIKELFNGNVGDTIHLNMIRIHNDIIIKKWVVSLAIEKLQITGYDYKELKYDEIYKKDNSVFHESHSREFFIKTSKTYGDKYFQIYLNERPSSIATHAIRYSFMNWSNSSSYDKIYYALPLLSNDDVWYEISDYILSEYPRITDKTIIEKSIKYLENLNNNTTSLKAKTVLLNSLGTYYYHQNEKQKASLYFKKVLLINNNIWYTKRSKKYLNDIKYLNIGQKAPIFCINDINYNQICLKKLKGKYVILHFWSPYCGFSKNEFKYLKDCYRKYNSNDSLFMLGVLVNFNKNIIIDEKNKSIFSWPQVLQDFDNNNSLLNQYSIHGVPNMFVIDKLGNIIHRDLRGLMLIKTLDELLLKN